MQMRRKKILNQIDGEIFRRMIGERILAFNRRKMLTQTANKKV